MASWSTGLDRPTDDRGEVLWYVSNKEFVPDESSDEDDVPGSEYSAEEWDLGESDEEVVPEEDEESQAGMEEFASTSTSPPPIRRCRRQATSPRPARPSYQWAKSFPGRVVNDFGGGGGVTSRSLSSNPTPLPCFLQFFTDGVMSLLISMTNLNAERKLQQASQAPGMDQKQWNPVDEAEMKAFLGLTILIGIIRMPTLDMYWQKKSWLFDILCLNSIMPRKRFREIWRYLHFCDETQAPIRPDDPSRDRLYKIRPLLDIILPLFETAHRPAKEISIDETLIPFKGRISFRQYIQTKRARFGIKVWVLAESSTGYVSRVQFYTGKDPRAKPEVGLSTRVVKYLISPFENLYHHLYVDNFYTSPALFEYLLTKGVYACGTIRCMHACRIGFPKKLIVTKG